MYLYIKKKLNLHQITSKRQSISFRQYLCVCRAGEAAAVSVWDVAERKRLRFLSCGEMGSEGYVSAAFSPDEQMVAAQGGGPDWTLVLFLWEKGKVKSLYLSLIISLSLSLLFSLSLCGCNSFSLLYPPVFSVLRLSDTPG